MPSGASKYPAHTAISTVLSDTMYFTSVIQAERRLKRVKIYLREQDIALCDLLQIEIPDILRSGTQALLSHLVMQH